MVVECEVVLEQLAVEGEAHPFEPQRVAIIPLVLLMLLWLCYYVVIMTSNNSSSNGSSSSSSRTLFVPGLDVVFQVLDGVAELEL